MINIGDVHVIIITLVSAKQVYNGRVKIFNQISHSICESVFHSVPAFSHIFYFDINA